MFNHIMAGSNDIERSARFYGAVLGLLGVGEPIRNSAPSGHTRLFYRYDGNTFIDRLVNNGIGRAKTAVRAAIHRHPVRRPFIV